MLIFCASEVVGRSLRDMGESVYEIVRFLHESVAAGGLERMPRIGWAVMDTLTRLRSKTRGSPFGLALRFACGGSESPACIALLGFAVAGAAVARAERPLTDLIDHAPQGALFVYWGDPQAVDERGAASMPFASAATWAEQAQKVGLLSGIDSSVRGWIDAISALSVLGRFPHLSALYDVRAIPLAGGGHRLSSLKAGLILDCDGDHPFVEDRIRHLLKTWTNTNDSSLTSETVNGETRFTLVDRRLKGWMKIEWGRVGSRYVLAIGDGAMQRTVEALAQPSQRRRRDLLGEVPIPPGARPRIGWEMNLTRVDAGVDTGMKLKVRGVREALGAAEVRRGSWVGGYAGRGAFLAAKLVRTNGQVETVRWLDPALATGRIGDLIPDEATRFAISPYSAAMLAQRIGDGYLAARSSDSRAESEAYWQQIRDGSGVSILADLFGKLGAPMILHDYPPHLLDLPITRTILFRIDGDANEFRAKLDELFTWLRDVHLKDSLTKPQRDDGTWYVSFGLAGPAVRVTDEWVVLGPSPKAVCTISESIRRRSSSQPQTAPK